MKGPRFTKLQISGKGTLPLCLSTMLWRLVGTVQRIFTEHRGFAVNTLHRIEEIPDSDLQSALLTGYAIFIW